MQNEQPARILIVDDHPNSADMLARVLARIDPPVEVMTASGGEQALSLIAEKPVDILITDFMMPGLNGLELIERLNGDLKPAHTILMTAYDTPGLAITARRLQIQDYLVKPVQPEKIRVIVSKAVCDLRPAGRGVNSGLSSARILVADDFPDILRLLSTRLENEGYTFLAARDGEETLRVLREEKPDLLLLDISMPKKDGFEVLAEMRADPDLALIPVIVVTAARIGPKDVREGLVLGADDYVIKPFDWRELAARIHSKLRVKFAEDRLRKRAQELKILPEISQAICAEQDLEGAAAAILQRTAQAFQADSARLDVFLSGQKVFTRRYWLDDQRWIANETNIEEAHAWGLNELALDSDRVILVADATDDDRWRSGRTGQDISAMAAPVISRGLTLGALTLTHHQAGQFHTEQAELLQAVARLAATAIENTILFGRLELAADMLRTPLMAALGYLDLLTQIDGLEPEAAEFARKTRAAVLEIKESTWSLMHYNPSWR